MKREPRKTLLLAVLLVVLLILVTVSALTSPSHEDADVRTHVVHEMVASLDGVLLHVGVDAAPAQASSMEHAGAQTVWLLVAVWVALWIARRHHVRNQQASRSKRS